MTPLHSDETNRASQTLDLMNQRLHRLSAAERDQRMQLLLAQATTSQMRFQQTAQLYNFLLRMKQASSEQGVGT